MREPDHQRLRASSHCGNIHVAPDWPDPGPTIPVRACGCDFCAKHGAAWTSHPDGRFYLHIADRTRVTRYRFGTRTADFHVCATCGVVPIVTCVMEGTRYAVVNANAFDGVEGSRIARTTTDFGGETTEGRLARRRRNWTPEAVGDEGKGRETGRETGKNGRASVSRTGPEQAREGSPGRIGPASGHPMTGRTRVDLFTKGGTL